MSAKKKICFEKDKQYNRFVHNFDFDSLKNLEILDETKNFYEWVVLCLITYIIVFVGICLTSISFFFLFYNSFFHCWKTRGIFAINS
jgi:hypothetical protein